MPGYNELVNPPQAAQPNFQEAGAFQQTLTPTQAPQQASPPTTPQELEQRKGGWMEFITKIRDDPALRNSIIMGASQLMKGPGMGQTSAGALGQAIQMGTAAHGFYKGNDVERQQAQQRLEQTGQQVNQQGKLIDSNISTNTAQTSGLLQQQQFEKEGQSYKQRRLAAEATGEEFKTENQPAAFQQEILDKEAARKLAGKKGGYYDNLGGRATAQSQPKTPAGVALLREREALWKNANPMAEDEDPMDYQARASASVYKDTQPGGGGGNPNAVKVQALQKLLADMDTTDPLYAPAKAALGKLGGLEDTGTTPAATTAKPKAAVSKAELDAASKNLKSGERFTVNGRTFTKP